MKLKQATQLAIIGVILQLFLSLNEFFYSFREYYEIFRFLNILGTTLLLPFFIILYKKQK